MVPPISERGGRFFGNDELKKETRILLKETQCRSSSSLSKRRTMLSLSLSFIRSRLLLNLLSCLPVVSQGREANDDGALRPIIFPSLRNISTPLQRTNSFYSRCRATLRSEPRHFFPRFSPVPCQCCVLSPSLPPRLLLARWVRDSNLGQPLNADHEFALFQLRERQ